MPKDKILLGGSTSDHQPNFSNIVDELQSHNK